VIGACIEEHVGRGGIVVLTTHRRIDTVAAVTRHFHFERTGTCSL
jgi:heme exporter protein A